MNRRDFLITTAAAAIVRPTPAPKVLPPVLRPGGGVGIPGIYNEHHPGYQAAMRLREIQRLQAEGKLI